MRSLSIFSLLLAAALFACSTPDNKPFEGSVRRMSVDSLRSDQTIEQWISLFLESAAAGKPESRQVLRDMAEAIESRLLKDRSLTLQRHHWESLRLRVLHLAAEFPENRQENAGRIREALDRLLTREPR